VPVVQRWQLDGTVQKRNPVGKNHNVRAIHYLSGCAHRCAFCPTQPMHFVADGLAVRLMENAAERLHEELSATIKKPQAVYVCPHSDPFPPLLRVQEETARVVEVLAHHRVQAWLMTRGHIRPLAMEVLAQHRDHVKVMMGMTTLDRTVQRILEPLSAPPRLRLKQVRTLRERGIPVQVALEPLVPGVTDTRENLLSLLEGLARAGVQRVTAGYLFLPPGTEQDLQQRLQPHGVDALVLDAFADGFERWTGEMGRARFLSRARRQRGYALLMSLAAQFGMTVGISSLSNPDFTRPETGKVFAQPRFSGMAPG
jgi:DNA repair photolyase